MNSDNEEAKLTDSMCEFLEKHNIEDLRAMNRDLDKKIKMEKDSKQWVEEAMDDMSAEIASIEKQNETTNLQIAESRKRIGKLREKIEILKVEKEAAEQAEFQRQKQEKDSGMTKEEKVKLNDQLNSQYAKISELEDKIEDLKKQKTEAQKEFTEYRSTMKEHKSMLSRLTADHEEVIERHEYAIASCQDLQNIVKELCEAIDRLNDKLQNSVEQGSDPGKSLFDEVTADKKKLETELIGLVDHTNALRHLIRQKQDEIDEIAAHETENTSDVDIEYVLLKMNQLAKKVEEIHTTMKQIEKNVIASVSVAETNAQPQDGEKVEFGAQYAALRDYGIECVRMKNYECAAGISKLKQLFYDFEQITIEYIQIQDRSIQAAK